MERINSGSEIVDALPSGVERWVVARITGIRSSMLSNWEKRGLITPKIVPDGARSVNYSNVQIARAFLINTLRKNDWTYAEISNHLSQPQWLKRNMKEIEAAINEVVE